MVTIHKLNFEQKLKHNSKNIFKLQTIYWILYNIHIYYQIYNIYYIFVLYIITIIKHIIYIYKYSIIKKKIKKYDLLTIELYKHIYGTTKQP